MCGVCAKIGFKNCVNDVLIGLRKLEICGYISSEIIFVSGGVLNVVKEEKLFLLEMQMIKNC